MTLMWESPTRKAQCKNICTPSTNSEFGHHKINERASDYDSRVSKSTLHSRTSTSISISILLLIRYFRFPYQCCKQCLIHSPTQLVFPSLFHIFSVISPSRQKNHVLVHWQQVVELVPLSGGIGCIVNVCSIFGLWFELPKLQFEVCKLSFFHILHVWQNHIGLHLNMVNGFSIHCGCIANHYPNMLWESFYDILLFNCIFIFLYALCELCISCIYVCFIFLIYRLWFSFLFVTFVAFPSLPLCISSLDKQLYNNLTGQNFLGNSWFEKF